MSAILAERLHSIVLPLVADTTWPSVDGDCIPASEEIQAHLLGLDIPARLAVVTGWVTDNVIGFMHHAVEVDGLVVDATMSQFGSHLGRLVIEPIESYLRCIAAATGLATTISLR